MKSSPWFVGIDLGTGSCKSAVVDEHGKIWGLGARSYGDGDPERKWVEQDPDLLLPAAVASVRTAVERSGLQPQGCAGISLGGALHSILALDIESRPLTGVMTWADGRAIEQSKAVRESTLGRTLYQETGCPVHGMYPLYKIKWLQDERPEIYEKAFRFVSAKEYVLSKLTGEFVVDYSLAAGSGLLDARTLQWSGMALGTAGIQAERLSRLSSPEAICGRLSQDFSKEMGIPSGTPIVLGSSDAVNSSLGAGAVSHAEATCMVGTSGALRVIAASPILDEKARTWCYAIDRHHWLVGGAINNGGIVLSWLRDAINRTTNGPHAAGGVTLEEILQLAETVEAGADGLICLPFLAGERSPNWNLNARAVFFGLTLDHDFRHISRSILEGIAFRLRSILEALAGIVPVERIAASGGFTQSALWVQIVADALNRPIQTPVWGETSALGAAFWAMLGTGHLGRLEDVRDLVQMGENYHPRLTQAALYDRAYSLYTGIYRSLEGAFDDVASLQRDLRSK